MGSRQRGLGVTWAGEKAKEKAEREADAKRVADQQAREARELAQANKPREKKPKQKEEKPKSKRLPKPKQQNRWDEARAARAEQAHVEPIASPAPPIQDQHVEEISQSLQQQPKLRVLCLHGAQQNADIFANRLERLTRHCSHLAEFVFANGSIQLPLETGQDVATRIWYENEISESMLPTCNMVCSGFHKVLYSLLGHRAHHHQQIRFAVLCGAPTSPSAAPPAAHVNSLHIFGIKDELVPVQQSQEVAETYSASPLLHEHPEGHSWPTKSHDLDVVAKFLEDQMNAELPPEWEECKEEQVQELEALQAIYDERFSILSERRCRLVVGEPMDQEWLQPRVIFDLPYCYPLQEPPRISLSGLRDSAVKELEPLLKQVALDALGTASLFAIASAVDEWVGELESSLVDELASPGESADPDPCITANHDAHNDDAQTLAEIRAATAQASVEDVDEQGLHKGGLWKYCIGLVGKPSAGKVHNLVPEIGPTYGVSDPGSEFGRAGTERRLPLLIKDVAGLVPGAWQGLGRGNAFLNDLVDADVLLHIVDVSGSTDEGGNCINQDDNETGSHDPLADIDWVHQELHRWIFANVHRKWESIQKHPQRLPGMFTGYHASSTLMRSVMRRAGLNPDDLSPVSSWGQTELHELVAHFLAIRFPILLVLNKADLPSAKEHVQRVCAMHEHTQVVCASAERQLQKWHATGIVEYQEGSSTPPIAQRCKQGEETELQRICKDVFDVWGGTGVLAAVSKAVQLRPPVLVYPVCDLGTLKAYNKHPDQLSRCLVLKPGSSVYNVYEALKRQSNSSEHEKEMGEYVRAESLSPEGTRVVLRKDELVGSNNCVLRVMTNKKVAWQAKAKK